MPKIKIPLHEYARKLGGIVHGTQISCPGPGHSTGDRSFSIKVDASAPDGFIVHSFAGDDPILCKDYVRERLGLPAFAPKQGGGGKAWKEISAHEYFDADGRPYLLVR